MQMTSQHAAELKAGSRFAFGENWSRFLLQLDDDRISSAEQSLRQTLGVEHLRGKRFIDVGCGSGLFSLAARRLGATVHSIDYDPKAVACAEQLRLRYFPGDQQWQIEHGSVLDRAYLQSLGEWDVVYSWGVLHHTGNMNEALENVSHLVASGGRLFIAIYNDQGRASRLWLLVKKAYNRLPAPLRWLVLGPATLRLWGPTTIRDFVKLRPFKTWRDYSRASLRGMSPWFDVVDWVGGLPFEVARPEEIFGFYQARGFSLDHLKTCAGDHGCNEYVFTKS